MYACKQSTEKGTTGICSIPEKRRVDTRMRRSENWNSKGNDLYKLGKYEEAIECYDNALDRDPGDVDALCCKGRALKELGKYQEAIGCYNKALRQGSGGCVCMDLCRTCP